MAEYISFLKQESKQQEVTIGERAIEYKNSLTNVATEGRNTVCNEASEILSYCIPPCQKGSITNLAVGYVQSGKTMSFTMLTALAADNGYRVVVYLTGTKTNLQDQTYTRLEKDLKIGENRMDSPYELFDDTSNTSQICTFLGQPDVVLLFPIMKHSKHIDDLVTAFSDYSVQAALGNSGVLIVDDEADQASLNTYARKNSTKENWEEDDFSKTYDSILALKRVFPNHSYIQYTATPQSLMLIEPSDVLSPVHHVVLTPGKGYTGGKYFFKDHKEELIRTIPTEDIETTAEPLTKCPASLELALREFVLSVAVNYLRDKERAKKGEKTVEYLSMMVHIDGSMSSNSKYYRWINYFMGQWEKKCEPMYRNIQMQKFKTAYEDLCKTVEECPSLDTLFDLVPRICQRTYRHLMQTGAEKDVNWKVGAAHILCGADMLNRGFTIEHLSMSYMPRTNKNKATADTIEQRCRFFGYKMPYIDLCRVYLSDKAINEFEDYVDHEEIFRQVLKNCPNHTLREYQDKVNAMIISHRLKPTRTNILSKKLITNQLSGWKQFRTSQSDNLAIVSRFIQIHSNDFITDASYGDNIKRNHRHIDVPVTEAIAMLGDLEFMDTPNALRKNITIQYLRYLSDSRLISTVRFYEMSYAAIGPEMRTRKVDASGVPINLHMGYSANSVYPGDASFKDEGMICIQLYHLRLTDEFMRAKIVNKEVYNFAVWYPERINIDYTTFKEDESE